MPIYRGIKLALHSQFDIEALPEYFPRPQSYYTERGESGRVPPVVDDTATTCSVYVPVLPASQFWLSYSVLPPVPEDQLYVFKLFINGAHIVTWYTGKDEDWKGKTMFGLYYRGEGANGKKQFERRMFFFTPPDRKAGKWTGVTDAFTEDAFVEVRIHRAHGKKRIERKTQKFEQSSRPNEQLGVRIVNGGRAGGDQPKRFYKFALVDSLDQPFVAFRYYYRTWDQIQHLGLLAKDDETDSSIFSIIEPLDYEPGTPDLEKQSGGIVSKFVEDFEPAESNVHIDKGDSATSTGARTSFGQQHHHTCNRITENASKSLRSHRLSVPPSLKLDPPEPPRRKLPSIPQKNGSVSPTGYRPHPAYPIEEWAPRTPSPVKSLRDDISTPPMGRGRSFTASSLMKVVVGAWKRRGTPSSEASERAESRNTSRSVS